MTVLGLDVGGANLKAATPDKRAVSVPFALWKQPDRLPAALAELVAQFPDAEELAVTMTGELCDCFETKREGVNAILNAVLKVSGGRRVRVWSTDGTFVDTEEARRHHLKVAAANWHALATFAGQYVPYGAAVLVDIGSTTTDIIPILDGKPIPQGLTDPERLTSEELVYVGTRRTPLCSVLGFGYAAELFATTLDVYLIRGSIAEDPSNTDTADGRPATRDCAHSRLARMRCADRESMNLEQAAEVAAEVHDRILQRLSVAYTRVAGRVVSQLPSNAKGRIARVAVLVSGSGEFLARALMVSRQADLNDVKSLSDTLGADVASCVSRMRSQSSRPRSGPHRPRCGRHGSRVHRRAAGVSRLFSINGSLTLTRQQPAHAGRSPGIVMFVVKVGGSLFDHPRLGPGLRAYLDSLAPAPVLLVPGGGAVADVVRQLDTLHGLGEDASHWVALRSMSVTAEFLRRLLAPLAAGSRLSVLDAYAFALEDDARPRALPHSWDVTSDSIAARVAVVHRADRLVLLKSTDIPPDVSWADAAARGWVDPHFPAVVANAPLRIEVVNFRRWLDAR